MKYCVKHHEPKPKPIIMWEEYSLFKCLQFWKGCIKRQMDIMSKNWYLSSTKHVLREPLNNYQLNCTSLCKYTANKCPTSKSTEKTHYIRICLSLTTSLRCCHWLCQLNTVLEDKIGQKWIANVGRMPQSMHTKDNLYRILSNNLLGVVVVGSLHCYFFWLYSL